MITRARGRGQIGETFIELLFAVVLMSSVGVIFVSGLAGAAFSSRIQATNATANTLVSGIGEAATSVAFIPCATPAQYNTALAAAINAKPAGYTVSVTGVEHWDGAAYTAQTTTLAAAVDTASPTMSVAATAGLPAAGPYQLLVDNELMTVTAGFGTAALTVTRGTPPTAHAVGAGVQACPGLQRLDVLVTTPDARSQTIVVAKRASATTSTLTATAATPVVVGATTVTDAAQLTASPGATGTVTFTLYAVADPTCAGTALVSSPLPVAGNATYTSPAVDPALMAAPGDYHWIAAYSGDLTHLAVTTPCGAAGQTTTVTAT